VRLGEVSLYNFYILFSGRLAYREKYIFNVWFLSNSRDCDHAHVYFVLICRISTNSPADDTEMGFDLT
jgi:hypothetical protein